MGICECGFDCGETLAEQELRSGIKHTHVNLPGRCDRRCPAYDVDVRPYHYHSPEKCAAMRAEKTTATLRAELAAVTAEREALLARIEEVSGVTAAECPLSVPAALAALDKLDRMRPVVDAAVKLSHHHGAMVTLSDAVDDYLDSGGVVGPTRCLACDGDLPDCRCEILRTEGATAERARIVADGRRELDQHPGAHGWFAAWLDCIERGDHLSLSAPTSDQATLDAGTRTPKQPGE